MKRAYMDHAAATPVLPEVLAARLPFLAQRFGNPSAVCDLGSEDFAVLGAIGIKPEVAQGSRVFTLSRDNREEEVHHVLSHLPPAGENERSFSPVWRQKIATAAGAPR